MSYPSDWEKGVDPNRTDMGDIVNEPDDATPEFYKKAEMERRDYHDMPPGKIYPWPKVPLQNLEHVPKPGRGRHYPCPPTNELVPSVTNVLDILAKFGLIYGAANVEREHVMRCAVELHGDGIDPPVFENILLERVTAKLGKQMAFQVEWKKKASIGTDIHALVQRECRAQLGMPITEIDASDAAQIGFMAWQDWAKSVNLAPILVEQTVWSERMQSAGTLDLYGEMDYLSLLDRSRQNPVVYGIPGTQNLTPLPRRKCVFDWKANKCSKSQKNGIYPESLIQVSVYTQMLIELGHAPEDTLACIVRLPKTLDDPIFDKDRTGALDVKVVQPEERKKHAEAFIHMQKSWYHMKEEMR